MKYIIFIKDPNSYKAEIIGSADSEFFAALSCMAKWIKHRSKIIGYLEVQDEKP